SSIGLALLRHDDFDVLTNGAPLSVASMKAAAARRKGRLGCGHWPTGNTRTARRRTATSRRARPRWLRSRRVGEGSKIRFRGQTGKHFLILSFTGFDPHRNSKAPPFEQWDATMRHVVVSFPTMLHALRPSTNTVH